jgi:hypothetical protein
MKFKIYPKNIKRNLRLKEREFKVSTRYTVNSYMISLWAKRKKYIKEILFNFFIVDILYIRPKVTRLKSLTKGEPKIRYFKDRYLKFILFFLNIRKRSEHD